MKDERLKVDEKNFLRTFCIQLAQYCSVLIYATLHSTPLHSTLLHSYPLYAATLNFTLLHSTSLYFTNSALLDFPYSILLDKIQYHSKIARTYVPHQF